MTTEEKLKHFEEAAVERAKAKREAAIAEHQAALEKIEAEHMAETDRRAALQIKTETENLNRSINTALSKEQLQIRREISQKNDELKEKLFVEIKTQLEEYMSTPAYVKLLEKQIKDILKIAGGEHVTIYIDPNDQFLLQDLAAATNTAISVPNIPLWEAPVPFWRNATCSLTTPLRPNSQRQKNNSHSAEV